MIELLLAFVTQLGLFGLLAVSLALVFGTTRVVNLAVGDFVTLGAFVMVATAGLPFWLGVVISVVVAVPIGFAIQRGLLQRIGDNAMASLLTTWGIGMLIRQSCEAIWGATPRSVAAPVEGSVSVLGAQYPSYRLVAAAVALIVLVVVLIVVYRTNAGLRLRAVADNPTMAALLGTHPKRAATAAFVVATCLAVVAGALYSPLLGAYPSLGFSVLVPAFIALLLARPGGFLGAFLGAAVVVLLQVVLRRLLPDTAADAVFYAVVLVGVSLRSTAVVRKAVSWSTRTLRARPVA